VFHSAVSHIGEKSYSTLEFFSSWFLNRSHFDSDLCFEKQGKSQINFVETFFAYQSMGFLPVNKIEKKIIFIIK
tara:strand:- start:531 stop:752 length:222 start_codon:yes stop_codon:yes gene_type:complete